MALKEQKVKMCSMVALLVGLLISQAQTQPVLKMHLGSPDVLALLEWSSQPDEVYRVEYSIDLMGWTVAQQDIPSQGASTFWLDAGSSSGVTPRTPSIDPNARHRFYRVNVQRHTLNGSSISVIVNGPPPATVLSGQAEISASATSTRNLNSARLYVDGEEGSLAPGNSYVLPWDTRFYPNGIHRISVIAEDDSDNSTTGEDAVSTDSVRSSYGCANATFTFDNFLSNVRILHNPYRPDLGESQEVYGTWASPRLWRVDFTVKDDSAAVYRSYSGEGRRIHVIWDGNDSNGSQLLPQIIACQIIDLGPGNEPAPSPNGGGGGPPAPGGESAMVSGGDSESNLLPSSPWDALMEGLSSYFVTPPPLPPLKLNGVFVPWEQVYGPLPLTEVKISEQAQQRFLDQFSVQNPEAATMEAGAASPLAATGLGIRILFPYKPLGTFGVLYQGHHPRSSPSNRPSRGPGLGQVTFSAQFAPPWGPIKAASKASESLGRGFPAMGYPVQFYHGDDQCTAADLLKNSLGGNGIFNSANLSLFIGHSAACKETIISLGHAQSFIPIFNSSANTITWVGMNDMRLGGSTLKWAAFYSCNLFRDSPRANPIYPSMKNLDHLAMTGNLHIMQAWATEMSVHPDFAMYWPTALHGGTPVAANHTVLGAWRYICINTQPKEAGTAANISRSAYWPECAGDYVYGYGTQTDPFGGHIQGELLEDDQTAPAP